MIGRLYAFALPRWPLLVAALLAVGAYASVEGGLFLLVRPFAKAVTEFGSTNSTDPESIVRFRRLAYYVLVFSPGAGIACFAQIYLCSRLTWQIQADIRNRLCQSILPQSLAYFDKRRTGDFISGITNDVQFTEQALTFLYNDALLQPLQFCILMGIAFRECWQMELITLAFFAVVAIPVAIFGRKIRQASKSGLERVAELTDTMSQMFTGIRIVKAFQMEEQETEEFRRRNNKFIRRMIHMVTYKAGSRALMLCMGFLSMGICIIVASNLVLHGMWGLTWPRFISFVAVSLTMGQLTRKVTKSYNSLQQALGACQRIFDTVDHAPDIHDEDDAVEITGLNDGMRFDNVSFTYGDDLVLRNVTFDVKKGETVAVVGKSGAGKSTLMDLVARFYDPTEGEVQIDGQSLRHVKHASLLSLIGIVSQQTFLFNRSLAENIRYGRRDAVSREEIEAAARAANIHEYIETLPDGYDTEVGEFGVRLSGGQRQRIAIARAILKNAPILILDEAMVGLDSESEKLVREAIINLMKDRTTFVIAHDLTTIQHADRIIVMRDGRLVESGTHEELMQAQGEYWRLRSLQFGDSY